MYLKIDTPEHFAETMAGFPTSHDVHWLILLAERYQDQLPEIVSALNQQSVPFFGAVFPGLIQGRKLYFEGAVVRAASCIEKPVVVQLDKPGPRSLDSLPSAPEIAEHKPTLHLFIDCLSPDVSGFLADIFDRYGNAVNYFGGGSGNARLSAKPAVFTPDGVYANVAVAAMVVQRGRVGNKTFVVSVTDE